MSWSLCSLCLLVTSDLHWLWLPAKYTVFYSLFMMHLTICSLVLHLWHWARQSYDCVSEVMLQIWLNQHVTTHKRPHAHAQLLGCIKLPFLAATKQLYEWFSPSVRPSVRPSVCPSVCLSVTPFWLCSHHPIIMKFSGVITSDKSDVHAKGQGQRSRSQRSQPNLTVSGL